MGWTMLESKRMGRLCAVVFAVALVCAGVTACGRFKSADSLVDEARQYQQKGDSAAAEIQLKNALQKDGENAQARLMLGQIYLANGNAASAEKELRRALSLGIKPEQVVPALTQSLLLQGQFAKALEQTAALPAQGEIAALRGNAYLGLGKSAEAKAAFETALQSDAKLPTALIGLARSALLERKLDTATRYADEAIAKNPDNNEVLMFKAHLLSSQGATDEAAAVLGQVIKRKPDQVDALLARADLEIRQRQFAQAEADIQAAQKAKPKNLLATYMQSLLAFSQGKHADALTEIQKVQAGAPDYMPSALLEIGRAHV